jgi:hypothetical protein
VAELIQHGILQLWIRQQRAGGLPSLITAVDVLRCHDTRDDHCLWHLPVLATQTGSAFLQAQGCLTSFLKI